MDEIILHDPLLAKALLKETFRQLNKLELIASENFTSKACRQAQGSILTHKYAEGYPDHRYYGGCEYVDRVEDLARERAKKLFNCQFANVQPHSGSQANMAAYFATVEPKATVLSMDLNHGGHITHGSKVNFSGRLFNIVPYGVQKETGTIDYAQVEELAHKFKPQIIWAGASAYPRQIDFKRFREIADSCSARLYVDMAHIAGLVATGLHPSPFPYADIVTTTTHKTLRGPRGGMILTNDATLAKKIDAQVFPGIQGGPLMHVIAAKAVAFGEALQPNFKTYQQQIITNAQVLAKRLLNAGFQLVSGGTDNHLILVDLTNKNMTGQEAEAALDLAGITVNKNTIPFDTRSPKVTSGIRLGTPALTTRGFKEHEMEITADFIIEALANFRDEPYLKNLERKVQDFASSFPLFTYA